MSVAFPVVAKMEAAVEKLQVIASADLVMCVTRHRIGFWSLSSGRLESTAVTTPVGGKSTLIHYRVTHSMSLFLKLYIS